MKTITRFALLSTAAFTLLALPAGAQDAGQETAQEIDPYALYEAAKAEQGLQTSETQSEASEEIIENPYDSRITNQKIPVSDVLPIYLTPGSEDLTVDAGVEYIEVPSPDEDPKKDDAEAPQDPAEPETVEEAETEAVAAPALAEETPAEDAPADAETRNAQIPEPEPDAGTIADMLPAIDDPDKNAIETAKLNRADIAPYFLSAKEYLKLRGAEPRPQTTLVYEVTQSDLKDADTQTGDEDAPAPGTSSKTIDVMLAIGDDYVARQSTLPGDALRIYDFKYNRLLKVTPGPDETAQSLFSNAPLYALAHRNTRTVATMTKDGKAETIDLAPGVSLDAFWIESAMSWAMTERADDVILSSETDGAVLTYKDAPVFTVALSGDAYARPEHADALLAFAHLELPIHPTGLKQLYGAAPIKTMSITSKSPQSPAGQKQVWTLKSVSTEPASFPLPDDPVNTLTSTQTDPIAFVMNLAARGAAPGGPPDYDKLAEAVLTAMDADNFETAWLAAKRYEQFSRPCQKNNIRKACKALRDIEDMRKKPESLEILLEAYEDAEEPKSRVKALQALRPWLSGDNVPADIMRLAGVARAKIDGPTAKAAGLDDIKAADLIKGAVIKDPYRPDAYLAMAQYYAATGDYNASWNVFDALRSAIETDEKAKFAVDKVERGLQKRAPGYFLPAVMAER